MDNVIHFPGQSRRAPIIELADDDREARILKLATVIADELDFTLRKLLALRGPDEARKIFVERGVALELLDKNATQIAL